MTRFNGHIVTMLSAGFALVVAPAGAMPGPEPTFDLSWHTIDGGGGSSAGGGFALAGTIGQHDVGAMTGGGFELVGGFWGFGGGPAFVCVGDIVTSATFQPPPDGLVNGADLAFLLGEWGVNPSSPADMVTSATFQPPPDGVVNGADLAVLLGAWGTCE